MNKKIKLNTTSIIFFILNIIILLSMIILRKIYIGLGYDIKILNIVFIVDLIILLLCIVFNIYLLIYDNVLLKRVVISAVLVIICFGIINLCIVSSINKKYNAGYYEITQKLISYCENYYCNKYETINLDNKRKFALEKLYVDYNNETQLIKINVIYDKESIKQIDATIYSSNESYSSYFIKEQLMLYLSNLNIEIDEESINEAFNERDNGKVTMQKQTYKVKSIYEDKNLVGFETKIEISLQDN